MATQVTRFNFSRVLSLGLFKMSSFHRDTGQHSQVESKNPGRSKLDPNRNVAARMAKIHFENKIHIYLLFMIKMLCMQLVLFCNFQSLNYGIIRPDYTLVQISTS